MTIRKGLPAKNAATDADDTRYAFGGLVVQNADSSPRGGLLGGIRSVVSARANMAVDVAAFTAAAVRDGGVVLLANDGTVQVPITAAPASNSRYTVVYAKQNDSSSTVTTPDANDSPVIGTVDGTASATPVKPSIPVGAVELATIQVPSGATATNGGGVVINQTGQYTAAPGGMVPFRVKADLDAWTTAAVNQRAVVIADMTEYAWAGSTLAWVPLGITANVLLDSTWSIQRQRIQRGIGRVTGNNTNVVSKAVVFQTPFSDVPSVQVSYVGFRGLGSFLPGSLTAGSAKESQPQAVTANGFTASLALPPGDGTWTNTSDFYFSWIAIGPM